MRPLLDQIIEIAGQGLLGEGRRQFRIHALAAGVRFARGVRGVLLLQYLLMICCFLFAASLFSILWIGLDTWEKTGELALTLPLKVFGGLLLLTGTTLYLAVRERTWVKAMDLERQVADLLPPISWESGGPSGASRAHVSPGVDRDELAALIAQVLEAKLAERAKS